MAVTERCRDKIGISCCLGGWPLASRALPDLELFLAALQGGRALLDHTPELGELTDVLESLGEEGSK